jgi:hypothetical protein
MKNYLKYWEKSKKKEKKEYVHFSPLFMNRFFVSWVYTTDTMQSTITS